jgi:hypothetical protein
MDEIRIRGARTHNLKNLNLDLPRNRLTVITGLSGSGKFARLRHALRRGPAPLRRVALGLRAAVPAADGEARRRPDRGPLAGHRHRAEGHQPQPALDGRHRHRDPRLPAPALRPRRHAALSGARPAAGGAKRLADGGPRAGPAGRHQTDDPRPGGGRPQGRAARSVHRTARAGLRAPARGRQGARHRRPAQAREGTASTASTWWWTASRCAPRRASAWPSPSRRR